MRNSRKEYCTRVGGLVGTFNTEKALPRNVNGYTSPHITYSLGPGCAECRLPDAVSQSTETEPPELQHG